MTLIEQAEQHLEQSKLGANPRNRLYMDPEGLRIMQELVEEVKTARNALETAKWGKK